MAAIYRFGTHTETLLQDAASKASVVFTPAPAPAAQTTQPILPAAQYLDAGHRLAILQQSAAQASVVFPAVRAGPVLTVQRGFALIEQDPGPLYQPQSFVFALDASLFPPPTAATPVFGQIMANPQPFDPSWFTPLSYVSVATAALVPPIFPITRVMATGIGQYGEILRSPGDVFDILTQDFSDSTVDYADGNAGAPFFGWMKIVPPSTPLTIPGESIYDWISKRRLVF